MNHLEQLAGEWLQYRGYFVRTAVRVGPSPKGGHEGELDVVAVHPRTSHFLHVECSLDSNSLGVREARFERKFAIGKRYLPEALEGFDVPEQVDQIALLQFGGRKREMLGGGRIVWTEDLIGEIALGLLGTSPSSGAVPDTLPLLRTVQLAQWAAGRSTGRRLISENPRPLARPGAPVTHT